MANQHIPCIQSESIYCFPLNYFTNNISASERCQKRQQRASEPIPWWRPHGSKTWFGHKLGAAAAGVAEAPHLGSPDLGASGVGEGGSNNEIAATYDATSRRSAAVEAAQQLLGDGQSRSYVQCGEKIKEVEPKRKVEKVRREKEDRKNEKR